MALYWALRVAFVVSRYVPLSWRYRLGTAAGELVYWTWPAKRQNTRRTMAVVMDDGEHGRLATITARNSLRNYGRFVVDFLNLPNIKADEIVSRSHVRGWEHLDQAMELGKGVIFVTGHFGVWDYAPAVLSARYPGCMHVVAEPFTSPSVDTLIQNQRKAQGSTVIPMNSVKQMVRALHHKGLLAVLVDRPVHDDGVPVTFFGRRTTVPCGAAALAVMTGATILPGYFMRRTDGAFDGVILPPIIPGQNMDRDITIRHLTQEIFNALEQIIRHHPEHWYMFRNMWPTCAEAPSKAGVTA